jgi:hypothetical protein
MALAIHFDKMLRSGEVADLDELAANAGTIDSHANSNPRFQLKLCSSPCQSVL